MSKLYKYQTERITLPIGSNSVTEVTVKLDTSYDNVSGYTVHSVSQAAADKWDLGLVDRTGVLQDRTFQNEHISDTSVAMKDRYKDLSAQANGNQITIQIEPVEALTAVLKIDVVFKLDKRGNC